MRVPEFRSKTWPPLEEIFLLFADAGNLQAIKPQWLHFQILMPCPFELRAGACSELLG
jgi:hypothetical protein